MAYTLPPVPPGASPENRALSEWLHEVYKTTKDITSTDADLLQGQNGAYYLARTNHTGSQVLATISDVTATAAEVNLLDLAGLTAGWALIADSATTASWQAIPSAPVTSVFGRTGIITAVQADYDGFFLTPTEGNAAYLGIGAKAADSELLDGVDILNIARTDIAETFGSTITIQGNSSAGVETILFLDKQGNVANDGSAIVFTNNLGAQKAAKIYTLLKNNDKADLVFARGDGADGYETSLIIDQNGLATFSGALTVQGAFTSLGIDDNCTVKRVQLADTIMQLGATGVPYVIAHSKTDQSIKISGGSAGSDIFLYGSTHSSRGGDLRLRSIGNDFLVWDESVGDLEILTGVGAKTSALVIDSSQVVTLPKGQLKFPTAQNASSDPNTLDDYEEGTWTPTIEGQSTTGVGTYTLQTAYYTKIGNRVFIQGDIRWTAHTGSGGMEIGGVPFTAQGVYAVGPADLDSVTLGANNICNLRINATSSKLVFLENPVGGGTGVVTTLDTFGFVKFSLTYRI